MEGHPTVQKAGKFTTSKGLVVAASSFLQFCNAGHSYVIGSLNNACPALKLYAVSTNLQIYNDNFVAKSKYSFISIAGMTIDAAYASFTENILGSIEVGKRADLTILSQDIMTIPARTILDTNVVATIIDGKVVYGKL